MSEDVPPYTPNPPPPQRQDDWPGLYGAPWPYAEMEAAARHNMSAALMHILSSASHQLLARARQLSTSNETDRQLAVIFAQSACELHTEKALTDLMRHRAAPLNDAIVSLLGNTISLADRRVRKVYGALTDDHPAGHRDLNRATASWWADWHVSRDLRNDVAHEGKPVTPEQVARSVASAAAYIEHLTQIVAATLARPVA